MWPGQTGKTPFPQSWDAGKVLGEVSNLANDASATRVTKPNGRVEITGTRDGIEILVVVESSAKGGGIVTGYPTKLQRNPK